MAGKARGVIDREKHRSGIIPSIENIVSTAFLGHKLDLMEIAKRARNAEYQPRRFSAVILRNKEPRATALVFQSGKMVIMGAKSEEDAHKAAHKFTKMINKTCDQATQVECKDFKTHNVVGCADVGFKIDNEALRASHTSFAEYDPEVFPGLTYRIKEPDVVMLVFGSGKVVLTKAKKREEVYVAFEKMYPILQQFKLGQAT
eukprot:m.12604 g.12604  ORF g.12604 m.12604 type:complete len:202 (-) comp6433_c0_seq1:249-854(-)